MSWLSTMINNRANDKCPTCTMPIDQTKFTDPLSRKEFTISGMCQQCQDKTFKPDEEI